MVPPTVDPSGQNHFLTDLFLPQLVTSMGSMKKIFAHWTKICLMKELTIVYVYRADQSLAGKPVKRKSL